MSDVPLVTVFRPYPLEPGQKIHIEGGPRGGDWLVLAVTERSIRLECPVSHRQVEWDRFTYHAEDRHQPWPEKE